MTLKETRQRLDLVPLTIRERVGSEEAVEEIGSIKESFNVDSEKDGGLLAKLILRLMIEDLQPQSFAWEIKEKLGLEDAQAKKLSERVRDKILNPVEKDFKKLGIDISLIGNIEEPPSKPQPSRIPSPTQPGITHGIPLPAPMPSNKDANSFTPKPPMKLAPGIPKPTPGDQPKPKASPFILSRESSGAPLEAGKDFKLKIPENVFETKTSQSRAVPKPPKAAVLEIGRSPDSPPKPQSNRSETPRSSKVVHYTSLKTDASSSFAPAEFKPKNAPDPTPKQGMPPQMPSRINISGPKQSTPPAAPLPPEPPKQKDSTPQETKLPTPPERKPPKVVNFGPEEVK